MRSIEAQFSEFLNLSYKVDQNIINRQVGDLYIGDLVILRRTKISWDFIMLSTGEMISIPYLIIDIFKSLDVYHKGLLFRVKAESSLDYFIHLMLAFVHNIEMRHYETTLEGLSLLQKIGTKDFIKFLEEETGSKLNIRGVMCISKKNLTVYL